MTTTAILYFIFAGLCLCHILVRGGAPERVAGIAYMLASIATPLVATIHPARYHGFEPGIMAVDGGLMINFLVLAVQANRFWPIWLAGLHGTALFAHLAMAASSSTVSVPYYLFIGYVSYPIWAVVVVGAERHQARLRRFGVDTSWRHSTGLRSA